VQTPFHSKPSGKSKETEQSTLKIQKKIHITHFFWWLSGSLQTIARLLHQDEIELPSGLLRE
jgi:hypothetical protein